VHSFRSLLAHLATFIRNSVRFGEHPAIVFAAPTTTQKRAFDLPGVKAPK
jgi:hypothetical protein